MKKGLIDRFRSLPMARSAVLAGRTLADVVVNLFGVIIVIAVGYVVGFRFSTSVPEVLYGVVLLLLSVTRSVGSSRSSVCIPRVRRLHSRSGSPRSSR